MSNIKNKAQNLEANVEARDVEGMARENQNIYKTLVVISKRSKQLASDLKSELQSKLEEFAVVPETIEEVHENKEQIEISKYYERLPNPALIATHEYLNGELQFRDPADDIQEEEDEDSAEEKA